MPKPHELGRADAATTYPDRLHSVRDGTHQIDSEYIRDHETGDGISWRYPNTRSSSQNATGEFPSRDNGYVIQTSAEKDRWGFAFHRLRRVPVTKQEAMAL